MKRKAIALLMVASLFWLFPQVGWSAGETSVVPQASEPIPFKRESDGLGELSLRAFGSLILALGIGIGGLYALRRYFPSLHWQRSQHKKRVRVVEITRITPRASLWVIEFDGDTLLLSQSDGNVSVLIHKPVNVGGPMVEAHVE